MEYARLKGFAHVVIAVGGEPPRAFSNEKTHPSQGGEWRGFNLKGAMLLRGLLCRSRVLLAMTKVRSPLKGAMPLREILKGALLWRKVRR